jgi:hypothetical protein
MGKKYAIHPGYVISDYDGETHYITVNKLATLYGLKPRQYIVWDDKRPETFVGRNKRDYIHLYPRCDGNYNKDTR